MKYRILSCILAAVLTFTSVTPAFAEGTADTPSNTETVKSTESMSQETEPESESVTPSPDETDEESQETETETVSDSNSSLPENPADTESETNEESDSIKLNAVAASDEDTNTSTEGFVKRLYNILLLREPDEPGLQDWTSRLNNGNQSGADIISGFIHSKEFIANNYSNEQYVTILYRALLGREPDPSGFEDWTGRITEGFSRDYICSGFIGAPEFKELCNKYGIHAGNLALSSNIDLHPNITRFVNRLYTLILSRNADPAGRADWVNALVSGQKTAAQVVLGFTDSTELKSKNLSDSDYIDILYRAILGRESDPGGKANWLEIAAMGVSRDYIVSGFIGSQEFNELCADYNINRGTITLTQARDQNKLITAFVKQIYELGLQRVPGVNELNSWTEPLNAHSLSAKDFISGIVFSSEGKTLSSTDSDFVNLVYRAALLRTPGAEEINNGSNSLKNESREQFLSFVLSSPEFTAICEKYSLPNSHEGWNQSTTGWYYVKNGNVLTGWQRIDGTLYYFDSNKFNNRVIGWNYIDGYKYYFDSDGKLVQNVDPIIGKQSSYYVKVNTYTNTVSVYAQDGANGYIIPVKNIICSCGNPWTPTVSGTFTIRRLGYWWELVGPVWGQYVTQIYDSWLFHSAWYYVNGNRRTLSVSEYRKLGQNASHGCVRLTVADAKWIFDNCNGSTVTVYSSSSMETMFDKPARPNPVVISGDYGYDPTDPYFN